MSRIIRQASRNQIENVYDNVFRSYGGSSLGFSTLEDTPMTQLAACRRDKDGLNWRGVG